MSRDDNVKFIHNNINSKLLTDKDRFEIAVFITGVIGIDKIKDKGPDCALYVQNLCDRTVDDVSAMIKIYVQKNNERVKNMYK